VAETRRESVAGKNDEIRLNLPKSSSRGTSDNLFAIEESFFETSREYDDQYTVFAVRALTISTWGSKLRTYYGVIVPGYLHSLNANQEKKQRVQDLLVGT